MAGWEIFLRALFLMTLCTAGVSCEISILGASGGRYTQQQSTELDEAFNTKTDSRTIIECAVKCLEMAGCYRFHFADLVCLLDQCWASNATRIFKKLKGGKGSYSSSPTSQLAKGSVDISISSHHDPINRPLSFLIDGIKRPSYRYGNLVVSVGGHSPPWIALKLERDHCIIAVEIWNSDNIEGVFAGIYITVSPSSDPTDISYCVEDVTPANQLQEKFLCQSTVFGQLVNISFPDSENTENIKFHEVEITGY